MILLSVIAAAFIGVGCYGLGRSGYRKEIADIVRHGDEVGTARAFEMIVDKLEKEL